MEPTPQKRCRAELEDCSRQSRFKRQRLSTSEHDAASMESTSVYTTQTPWEIVRQPTADTTGRDGLRRAITLGLLQAGFDSAREVAIEEFTEIAENYMNSFIDQLKRFADAARRTDIIPTDFEFAFRYHKVPVSSLKPFLRNLIPEDLLEPTFYDPVLEDTTYLHNSPPILGDELDGKYEKEERQWIPKHFPSFPSKHTYRYTPADIAPKKPYQKRTEALADARKGEAALRRIDRAAKITRHKELKEVAQRNPLTKNRHDAWEGLMQSLLATGRTGDATTEVADHSTIVDAGAKHGRKELPRTSRRTPLENVNGQI